MRYIIALLIAICLLLTPSYPYAKKETDVNIVSKLQSVASTRDVYMIHIPDDTRLSYVRTRVSSEYNYDAIILQDYTDKRLYLIVYDGNEYKIFMTPMNTGDFYIITDEEAVTEIINKILLERKKL